MTYHKPIKATHSHYYNYGVYTTIVPLYDMTYHNPRKATHSHCYNYGVYTTIVPLYSMIYHDTMGLTKFNGKTVSNGLTAGKESSMPCLNVKFDSVMPCSHIGDSGHDCWRILFFVVIRHHS